MGTLGGFPNPPALWLRRAKPVYAYAIDMGTLGGFGCALGTRHTPCPPLASLGLANPPALWLRRAKPVYAYAIDMGTLGGFGCALGTRHTPCPPLASLGLANPPALWLRRAKPVYAYAIRLAVRLGGQALDEEHLHASAGGLVREEPRRDHARVVEDDERSAAQELGQLTKKAMIVPAVIFVKNEESRRIPNLRRMCRDLPLGQLIVEVQSQQERFTPTSQHA
jgi:hypothetical protein